jgi:hypothetical protein
MSPSEPKAPRAHDPSATCCAGCGREGTTAHEVPQDQVPLHWRRRGRWVCAACAFNTPRDPIIRLPRRFLDSFERVAGALERLAPLRERDAVSFAAARQDAGRLRLTGMYPDPCPFCATPDAMIYLRGNLPIGCRVCLGAFVVADLDAAKDPTDRPPG